MFIEIEGMERLDGRRQFEDRPTLEQASLDLRCSLGFAGYGAVRGHYVKAPAMKHLPRLLTTSIVLALLTPVAWVANAKTTAGVAVATTQSDWRELGVETLAAPPEVIAAHTSQRGVVRVVTVAEEADRPEITVTEVPGREAAKQAIAEAQADPDVLAVEIDGQVSALQSSPWNDPWRDLQWGLDRLSAEEANYRVGARASP